MTTRRILEFSELAQAEQDVRQLLEKGYTQTGQWNLAQTCLHLNDWLGYSMDGYPKTGFPVNLILAAMKFMAGRSMLKKILREGFKEGGQTMPQTVHPPSEQSDQQAVQKYCQAIDRFNCHNGAFHPSPLFGHVTPQEMNQLQCIHAAHHLSFLLPNE